MINRITQVAVKEHELPAISGGFKLSMHRERSVLGIVQANGKNLLLFQEESGNYHKEFSFEVVESGTTVKLSSDFEGATEYLGSYSAGGKLLHVYGIKTGRRAGGAAVL
jgi:hypothetical protein